MTKKTKKKFTVPEFKTWLEGIMQFQNEEWSPTREQWDEIYSKIMDLKEPVNKDKISLTQGALDEINDIVYYHITNTLKEIFPPPSPNLWRPQQAPQIPEQEHQNYTPNHQDDSYLANVSLSEIKKLAEENANIIGDQRATHKLPDQTENAALPKDFV